MTAASHRLGATLLLLLLAAFFVPPLVRGEVIFAHDNATEVAMRPDADSERVSNRKFADHALVYLPEIHHHLNGRRAGWISTWNPHVEMGRPTAQLAGYGRAFPLTLVLSWFTRDALLMYTLHFVCAIVLTTLFTYLLCHALGLGPVGCFVGAAGMGLGIFPLYWSTFVLFAWGVCWSVAALWLIASEVRHPSVAKLLGLAFALYALLLSGYPQQIVWHAYILVGFTLWSVLRGAPTTARRLVELTRIGGAALVGALAVAPAYLDLALNANLSARLDTDVAFFLAVLPEVASWQDAARFFLLAADPFWFGEAIDPAFPLKFNGLALGLPLLILAAVTLGDRALLRRLWPVHLFCALAVTMTVWPPAYAFGVEHLGLSISRTNPLAGAYVPALVLAAYGADRLVGRSRADLPRLAVVALAVVATGLCAALAGTPLDPTRVTIGAALLAATAFMTWRPRALALLVVVALATLHYGIRLPLWRTPAEIHLTSPLVDLLRQATDGGRERYALVAGGHGTVLPANQEALTGLRSIHSYNSLSPKSYQDWVLRLSERGTQTYGRHFHDITSDALLGGPELGYSGVSILVAGEPLHNAALRPLASGNGVFLYAPRRPPLQEAQIGAFTVDADGARVAGELADADLLALERVDDLDDHLSFRTSASERETLLFVSQKRHPQWHAFAGDNEGTELETVAVNGFYQGVRLPPGTTRVHLRFLPWVRWSWIPELGFALGAVGLGGRAALQRRRRRK